MTYEYQVGETTYRASRLSFADHISGPAMAAALQRFPAGRRVQVYYNPRNPREAVLERELPPGVVLWIGLLAAGMVGAALFILLAVGSGAGWLATWIPALEKALFVALAAGIGIFSLVMAYALHHQVQASTYWSAAAGRVLSVRDEVYLDWVSHGSTGRLKTFCRPGIVYAYSVDGHQYLSDRIDFDLSFGWGNRASVQSVLEKYPKDSAVTVYYDPGSPGEAVLERKSKGVWVFAATAGGLFLLAAWAEGWI